MVNQPALTSAPTSVKLNNELLRHITKGLIQFTTVYRNIRINSDKNDMAIDTFWYESIVHKIGKVLINYVIINIIEGSILPSIT